MKKLYSIIASVICIFYFLQCNNIYTTEYDYLTEKVPVVSTFCPITSSVFGMTIQDENLFFCCFSSYIYKKNLRSGAVSQYSSNTGDFCSISTIGSTLYVGTYYDFGYIDTTNGNTFTSLNLSPPTSFNNIGSIVSAGNDIFMTDFLNNRILKNSAGVVSVFAGGTSGFEDGTGTSAKFDGPYSLCSDGIYLYVTDEFNHAVRRICIITRQVETIAGPLPTASPPYGFIDGIGSAARFHTPAGIILLGNSLFVVDSNNNAIRKINLFDFAVSTIAGNGTQGSEEGVGTDARFNTPYAIATDGSSLYISDLNNSAIKKISFIPRGEAR
jgi:hypothetical protein